MKIYTYEVTINGKTQTVEKLRRLDIEGTLANAEAKGWTMSIKATGYYYYN